MQKHVQKENNVKAGAGGRRSEISNEQDIEMFKGHRRLMPRE